MEQAATTKESSIGEILSDSWQKFKQNYVLILKITLIIYIPINIILSFVPAEAMMDEMGALRGFRAYLKIIQILEGLIGILATMSIMYLVKQAIDNKTVTLKEALLKAVERWTAAIGTNILSGIFLVGLTLLLIVPGIIYALYWAFIIPIVVLCNESGRKALDHSKQIVQGRWWKIFGYVLVFGILGLLAGLAIGVVEGIIISFLPESFLTNIFDVALSSGGDFLMAYFTVVSTLYFLNLDSTKKVAPPTKDTAVATTA